MIDFIDQWKSLSFRLRTKVLGRVKIRRGLPQNSSLQLHLDHDFYSMVIERASIPAIRETIKLVWDIGCRNWSYADATAQAFPNATLNAVEVDSGRRLADLYVRQDHTLANADRIRKESRLVNVFLEDFCEIQAPATDDTMFCFFYPFVSKDPCHAWGLPEKFSDFSRLLKHGLTLSRKNCFFLSCHQGKWESEIAFKNYKALNLNPKHIIVDPSACKDVMMTPYEVHIFFCEV